MSGKDTRVIWKRPHFGTFFATLGAIVEYLYCLPSPFPVFGVLCQSPHYEIRLKGLRTKDVISEITDVVDLEIEHIFLDTFHFDVLPLPQLFQKICDKDCKLPNIIKQPNKHAMEQTYKIFCQIVHINKSGISISIRTSPIPKFYHLSFKISQ